MYKGFRHQRLHPRTDKLINSTSSLSKYTYTSPLEQLTFKSFKTGCNVLKIKVMKAQKNALGLFTLSSLENMN